MQAAAARPRSPARRPAAAARAPAAPKGARPASGLPRFLQRRPQGEALPPGVQAEMSQRLGTPLDAVRVHTGAGAAASARAMGASAYTHGNEVVFGAGAYDPQSARGRSLLAHELTHVAQQRRAGMATQPSGVADGGVTQRSGVADGGVTQRSGVADGGARGTAKSDLAAEREAELNARRIHTAAPLTAQATPQQPVQRNILGDIGDAVGDAAGAVADVAGDAYDAAGDAVDAAVDWTLEQLADAAMALVRRVAPPLADIIESGGPLEWLKDKLAGAFEGIVSVLNALNPINAVRTLVTIFATLVERGSAIVAALASGDCQPLMDAIGELKDFVTETAGAAWDKLTEFFQPIGEFFGNLWSSYGAPALEWLERFGGAVWAAVRQFASDLWDWTEPIRDVAGRIWNWVKEQLFGSEDGSGSGESSGGLWGWVSGKAAAAWDWVKETTRPVWEPVAGVIESVAEMLPPQFLRGLGERMQHLSTDLNAADEAMAGGDAVAENRETLAGVLPSVQRVIGGVRGVISHAGSWVSQKVGGFGGLVSRLFGGLRGSSLLAWLATLLGWLEDAALQLVAWAQQGVEALFGVVLQAFDYLRPFIEAAAGVVRRLIGVVGNLMHLAQLILSSVWRAIPCCIREPIKNFLLNQILGRIPVFGQFFTDPTLWPRVQATAMRILRQIFVDGDLAGAAWTFFRAVLRVLGLPPELVVQVLAKAVQALGDILTNPIGFLLNLLGALRRGFGLFFEHIATHLLGGVTGWLFGRLREAGIEPPRDFSVGSILGFVLQVLGVTVEHIFERLAARLDARTVARLRGMLSVATGVWRFVSILVTEGPAGLWREVQAQLGNLWDQLLNGVIGWVTEAIIGRAQRWLLALLDVTGIMPVINAMVAVYNAIESFIQYLREMLEIVNRMLDGILGIAQGALDAAAGFLEGALADALPVAIGFLANQFGLGRLAERISEMVAGVRATVDRAIDWLLDRAIRLGQGLIDMARRGAAAVRDAASAVLGWWRLRVGFTAEDGEEHHLYFRGEGRNAELIVESEPQPFRAFLAAPPRTARAADVAVARALFERIQALQAQSPPTPSTDASAAHPDSPDNLIPRLTNELAVIAARMMPASSRAGERSTPPRYGSLRHGFGTQVDVDSLTGNAAPGSEPGSGVAGGLWERLRRRLGRAGGSSYYVRGHLLNHHLGGSGETWANLTPLTQSANNRSEASMYRSFERPVKQAVIDQRKTVRALHVSAAEGQPARGTDLAAIDREIGLAERGVSAGRQTRHSAERLHVIRDVVEAEQHIPARMTLRAEILAPAGTPESTPSTSIGNAIDTDWRGYAVRVG